MTIHSADNVPVAMALESRLMVSVILLLAGSTFCLAGARGLNPDALADLGLIAIMDWRSWLGLALLVAGFSLSLTGSLHRTFLPWLFLVALVAALHLVPAYTYGTLRYSWAWKHIGIVDYIIRHGGVDRDAAYLSAYHNWPGFFLVWSWVAQRFSWEPLEIAAVAAYAPPAFAMANLLALYALLSNFTRDSRLIFLALLFFLVGNWVGQDYFSPQAATFLLYLIAMFLCTGPLAKELPAHSHSRPSTMAGKGEVLAATLLLLAITAVIAASHQLTPLVLASSLFGFALVRRLDLGFAAFAAVVVVLWNLYFAAPFVTQSLAGELEQFGAAFVNATENLVDLRQVSQGQAIVSIVSRALTIALMLLAVIGFIRRLRLSKSDLSLLIILVSPLPVFVMTSYGGEAVFRVYMFMLPALAFLAAASIFPSQKHGRSVWQPIVVTLTACALITGFLISNNGKDMQYRFRHTEVEAAAWMYDQAPAGALLVEGARNYPSQFANYENFVYVPIANESTQARKEIAEDPARVFDRWLSDERWPAAYVIFTRSQKAYAETQGVFPEGTFDRITRLLAASPRFRIVFHNADAVIFALNEMAPGGAVLPSQ
jgi:hypothetical protein